MPKEMTEFENDELLVAAESVSLRSRVADRLRQAIVTGRFLPGSQLRERELCQLTGVSRPSLREALGLLEAEGLITNYPRRGQAVTALTVEEVGQIYALRRVLESFAASEFARQRHPDDLAKLKAAVKGLDEARASGKPFEMLKAGTAFYKVVDDGSRNPYLAQSLGALRNRIAVIRFISLHQASSVERGFAALYALSEAIFAGDEALTKRLCAENHDAFGENAKAIVEANYRLPGDAKEAGTQVP